MQLPTRAPPRRALTASATKLRGKDESEYAKRVAQPWQYRALDYYDQIGEIRFSSQFYARQLSRVRLFPATLEPDGKLTPIEDGPPVELLDRVQDPGGKRSRIQYDYGRLMFVTGEGILLVTGEGTDEERWRFLWRDEVRISDNGVAVRLNWQRQPTKETGTAYRMWTPHPRQSDLADAPLRAVLDIAEELIILTQSVRGTAVSRLLNGLLKVPSDLSLGGAEGGSDEDPNENPWLADFIDHVQAQIDDPGSAAAKVPYLVEASYDYLDRLEWVKLHDPATDYMERDLRIEAVKRLALGLDFPPEVLLGMTDANHWTALQVQQDMWRSHGAAVAEQMAHDFAEVYLRPALRDDGFTDWEDVVIGYDDSQVVVSPDRSADADAAADRGMISDTGYRTLKAIPEAMEPSQEEKDRYLAIKLRDPAIIGEPGPAPTATKGPVAAPESNGDSPGIPPAPAQGRVVSRQEARVATLVGGATLAIRQCRGRAGARLRSYQACSECKEKTDGLANSLVASVLGVEQVFELAGRDTYALVRGGTDEFHGLLMETGVMEREADSLCQRLEMYAAKTLFDRAQPELPPGFAAQCEQALELSEVAA